MSKKKKYYIQVYVKLGNQSGWVEIFEGGYEKREDALKDRKIFQKDYPRKRMRVSSEKSLHLSVVQLNIGLHEDFCAFLLSEELVFEVLRETVKDNNIIGEIAVTSFLSQAELSRMARSFQIGWCDGVERELSKKKSSSMQCTGSRYKFYKRRDQLLLN